MFWNKKQKEKEKKNNWYKNNTDYFNLDDFCHIWIERKIYFIECKNSNTQLQRSVYYAMGQWRRNGENVIISEDFDCQDELENILNKKLFN